MTTQEESTKELTPLNSTTNSIIIDIVNGTGAISDKIESYGSINISKTQTVKFNSFSLLVLYLIFWCLQTTKKLMFPFIMQFALFYNVSIEMFAFAICCHDIGCIISILIHWYTNNAIFKNVYIHLMFFLLMITISILYAILSLSNTFITLTIINLVTGFIFNTLYVKINTIMHLAPTSNINTTDGMYGLQSTNFVSTLNWAIAGFLINNSYINYIWYYIVGCSVIISLFCYFLPHSTISKARKIQSRIAKQQKQQKHSENNENIPRRKFNIWKQSYLYWFILNGFFVSMSYYAFLTTFGTWIMIKFQLNSEQFGYELVIVILGGYGGYLFFEWLRKYEIKIIHISMFTTFACVISMTLLSIAIQFNVSAILVVWTFVFLYAVFSEMVFGSLNVSNLKMISKNLRSTDCCKVNLLLDFMNELGTIIGITASCYILKVHNFGYVVQGIMVIQFIALACICVTNFQFNKETRQTLTML